MAVIDKKLIHFTNLTTFEQRLNAGDIKDTSIVFIQDAKRIWTHNQYYSSPYTKEEIDQLFVGSNITLDGYNKDGVAEIVATDTVNSAFGKIEDYLESLIDLNAILVDTGVSVDDITSNDNILSGREIKDIKNKYTEELIYPRTHAKAVTVGIDTSLEDSLEILNKINNTIKFNGNGTSYLANDGTYKTINFTSIELQLANKVDKVTGKGLSTEDFTTALKDKLLSLSNYDDTDLNEAIENLRTDFDTLVSGDTTTAIKSFNDIIAFLEGIEDSEDLDSIIASIEQQIASKLNIITDLSDIRTGASLGATAVLPTAISDMETKTNASATYATKTELSAKGTYSKPSGGIPKTDLASAVQTSLGKADTALQSYTETDPVFKASAAAGITSANITSWNGKQDASLKFTDKAASTWVSDSTYANYPYRCDIACTGVTADMYAEVTFSMEQATSGDYAPVCETKSNVVSIWSKINTSITVPTIIITK